MWTLGFGIPGYVIEGLYLAVPVWWIALVAYFQRRKRRLVYELGLQDTSAADDDHAWAQEQAQDLLESQDVGYDHHHRARDSKHDPLPLSSYGQGPDWARKEQSCLRRAVSWLVFGCCRCSMLICLCPCTWRHYLRRFCACLRECWQQSWSSLCRVLIKAEQGPGASKFLLWWLCWELTRLWGILGAGGTAVSPGLWPPVELPSTNEAYHDDDDYAWSNAAVRSDSVTILFFVLWAHALVMARLCLSELNMVPLSAHPVERHRVAWRKRPKLMLTLVLLLGTVCVWTRGWVTGPLLLLQVVDFVLASWTLGRVLGFRHVRRGSPRVLLAALGLAQPFWGAAWYLSQDEAGALAGHQGLPAKDTHQQRVALGLGACYLVSSFLLVLGTVLWTSALAVFPAEWSWTKRGWAQVRTYVPREFDLLEPSVQHPLFSIGTASEDEDYYRGGGGEEDDQPRIHPEAIELRETRWRHDRDPDLPTLANGNGLQGLQPPPVSSLGFGAEAQASRGCVVRWDAKQATLHRAPVDPEGAEKNQAMLSHLFDRFRMARLTAVCDNREQPEAAKTADCRVASALPDAEEQPLAHALAKAQLSFVGVLWQQTTPFRSWSGTAKGVRYGNWASVCRLDQRRDDSVAAATPVEEWVPRARSGSGGGGGQGQEGDLLGRLRMGWEGDLGTGWQWPARARALSGVLDMPIIQGPCGLRVWDMLLASWLMPRELRLPSPAGQAAIEPLKTADQVRVLEFLSLVRAAVHSAPIANSSAISDLGAQSLAALARCAGRLGVDERTGLRTPLFRDLCQQRHRLVVKLVQAVPHRELSPMTQDLLLRSSATLNWSDQGLRAHDSVLRELASRHKTTEPLATPGELLAPQALERAYLDAYLLAHALARRLLRILAVRRVGGQQPEQQEWGILWTEHTLQLQAPRLTCAQVPSVALGRDADVAGEEEERGPQQSTRRGGRRLGRVLGGAGQRLTSKLRSRASIFVQDRNGRRTAAPLPAIHHVSPDSADELPSPPVSPVFKGLHPSFSFDGALQLSPAGTADELCRALVHVEAGQALTSLLWMAAGLDSTDEPHSGTPVALLGDCVRARVLVTQLLRSPGVPALEAARALLVILAAARRGLSSLSDRLPLPRPVATRVFSLLCNQLVGRLGGGDAGWACKIGRWVKEQRQTLETYPVCQDRHCWNHLYCESQSPSATASPTSTTTQELLKDLVACHGHLPLDILRPDGLCSALDTKEVGPTAESETDTTPLTQVTEPTVLLLQTALPLMVRQGVGGSTEQQAHQFLEDVQAAFAQHHDRPCVGDTVASLLVARMAARFSSADAETVARHTVSNFLDRAIVGA